MWRRKKFILVGLLAAVVLVGSIGGVAFAQTENGDASQPEAQKYEVLLDRICEIYQEKTGVTINQEALKDAFAQAQNEMSIEALKARLQSLVEQGRITQDEADQYLQWQQARPDVPFGFSFKGRGGIRGMGGMGGMRGSGGPCVPWDK